MIYVVESLSIFVRQLLTIIYDYAILIAESKFTASEAHVTISYHAEFNYVSSHILNGSSEIRRGMSRATYQEALTDVKARIVEEQRMKGATPPFMKFTWPSDLDEASIVRIGEDGQSEVIETFDN